MLTNITYHNLEEACIKTTKCTECFIVEIVKIRIFADFFKYHDLDLTFQGHPRSKVKASEEPECVITYTTTMITKCLR